MDARIRSLEQRLDTEIQHKGLTLEQARDFIREEFEQYFDVSNDAFKDLDIAYERLKSRLENIDHLTRVNAVRTRRQPWYSGPAENSPNWNAYEDFLVQKGWGDAIPSIDDSSTQVVSLLYNPGTSKFESRGLALGYVQSGKTANMTAVIAKAADAGYRLVIILTGMIEKLRRQTQARIESDLTLLDGAQKWHHWTTREADFNVHPTYPGFQFDQSQRNIFVIKKQKDVLERIVEKLKNTDLITKNSIPVLVIDDECDQASVNASGKENEITTLNRLIRQIMEHFPRHSYVGYTATPFANVLIDPSVNPNAPLDLYPKDFIYTLPKPEGYFGAEKLFGRDLLDAEQPLGDDEELDIIRNIPDDEVPSLTVKNGKSDFELTDSAKESLDYFLIATAIRNLRGQREQHSTMLFHTSHLRSVHGLIANEVRELLKSRINLLRKGSSKYLNELRKIWDREKSKVPPSLYGYDEPDFEDLIKEILATAEQSRVIVVNSESDDVLDYGGKAGSQGRRYIAIGGNVISRGLTLEGLVSSFFMRTSRQYDTLMQMGRWFGYRHGYEDLPRVWMTKEMEDTFYRLATVEADIREKIRVYEQEEPDITPLDVAVKIRQIPGLAVTARNKMRAARKCSFSFAGEHRQTTRFPHKDAQILKDNWEAAELLVNKALESSVIERSDQGILVRNVDRALIEAFLDSYTIHPTHADLVDPKSGVNHLLSYISKRKAKSSGNLKAWNLGIIQPKARRGTAVSGIEGIESLKLINRSMFQELVNGDADIKSLMSRSDITIDMGDYSAGKESWEAIKSARKGSAADVPLLLLYPIDKGSEPESRTVKKSGKKIDSKRLPLNADLHVMGMGILFPKAAGEDEASHYIEVQLPELEERDEVEEEESEEFSAS